ncbi:unnamed protein product, partial [Prorocentrum cordatum]
ELQRKTVETLKGTCVTTDWQLEVAPKELLVELLPPGTKGAELTLCLHAQQAVAEQEAAKAAQPGTEAVARQVARLGRTVRKTKAGGREPSSLSTSPEKDFDAFECLRSYGLGVKSDRNCRFAALRALAASARKDEFAVPGALNKFSPQWMDERYRPQTASDVTHAQWTAMWWGRALAQLTCQAHTQKEVVTVETILGAFLDVSRIALEDTRRVASDYDATLWSELADRTRRKDATCIPKVMLEQVDENRRARANSAARAAGNARSQTGFKRGSKGRPQYQQHYQHHYQQPGRQQ